MGSHPVMYSSWTRAMKTGVLCSIVILMCHGCADSDGPRAAQKRRAEVGWMMKAHYQSKYEFEAGGPLTLAEFEKELREFHQESFELKEKVYGRADEWLDSFVDGKCARIKNLSKEMDELYFFTSEPQSWAELAGIDGYVLVRKKEIVDMMVRCIN